MNLIKQRTLNTWNKRIYIQDKILNKTRFTMGTRFNAYYVPKLRKIYLLPCDTGKRKVSHRNNKQSVIDIKSLDAMSKLQEYETLKINIFKDKIIVEGEGQEYRIDESLLNFKDKNDLLKVISVCSGAGFLDRGFMDEGFEIVYAIEFDKPMYETYRYNYGNHIVHGDLNEVDISKLPYANVLIGGIPCKGYSNENRRTGHILDCPNNNLIRKYIEIVEQKEEMSVFVIENVAQILTKGKKFVDELKDRLNKFKISIQILDAKFFGSPQERKRAIIIGSKMDYVHVEDPKVDKFTTVREAFKYLDNTIPNQTDHPNHNNEVVNTIRQIKPGQNYNDYLGYKKRHSNQYKRLNYNKHCHTITHAGKTMTLHPEYDRAITVREAARLFDVPDDFVFVGSISKRYEMIGNGVTVNMARGIAKEIKKHILKFS